MSELIKNRIPVVDSAKCAGCKKCMVACPNGVIVKTSKYICSKCIKYCITMKVPCNPNNIVFIYEQCDACGLCISECPNNAIYWFDFK